MENLLQRLKLSGSTAALLIASAHIGSALAQGLPSAATPAPSNVEEVTVTGTSIRGAAPVGSNVITVDQEAMRITGAVNEEQLLNTVTAISTSGGPPQGVNVNSGYQPQIHQLAGSVSNSTLAVINGMRFVGQGVDSLSDPNIIPTSALERVEVLADGASSVYGSDAVSGVVNFIVRKDFEGLEINGQTGFANNYNTSTANLLWGTKWDSGSVMFAASYTYQSALSGADRGFLAMGDYTPLGGNNFIEVFGCPTAAMIVPGNSGVYLSPSSTTTVSNTQASHNCNIQPYGDALPESTRRNTLMQVRQDFGSKLSASVMLIYNELDTDYRDRPGAITTNTTAFGPGSGKAGQINPFYQAPAGAPGATQENVSWVDLMGTGPNGTDYGHDLDNEEAFYAQAALTYKLNADWQIKFTDALGVDRDDTNSLNTFCPSCATLALNGTGSTSGSTTASNVAGLNIVALNTPLTTTNALDVWHPVSGNLTSTLVRQQLYSGTLNNDNENTFNQARLEIDGPVFQLPAGAVRVAAGGEYANYHQLNYSNGQLGVGNPSLGASISSFRSRRNVFSAFGEINAPLISEDMGIPLVQEVGIDVSARFDQYSDVGPTFNPKYGIDWRISPDIKLRANYSTSFVAAPLGVVGDPSKGGEYSGGASIAPAFNVPIAAFQPVITQLPGCNTVQVLAQGFCQLGSGTSAPGLSRQYGTALTNARPQTGNGINIGADFTPGILPGLVMNITYFNQEYKGGITAPNATQITSNPAFYHLLTLCPTGCTQQQINDFTRVPEGGTVSGTLPATIYDLQNHDETNVLNLSIQGIDLTARYDVATSYGDFHVGEGLTQFFVFDQNTVGGASFSELGTSGINSTFPSIAYHSRTDFGWSNDTVAADIFVNWTAPYTNASNTAVHPIITDANGNFSGGGDHVDANVTVDAHVSYDFDSGLLSGDQIYVDIQNLFDVDPPFYNGTSKPSEVHSQAGENIFVSNPIGRLVSVGLRAKF